MRNKNSVYVQIAIVIITAVATPLAAALVDRLMKGDDETGPMLELAYQIQSYHPFQESN